jgi:hypothetical protein
MACFIIINTCPVYAAEEKKKCSYLYRTKKFRSANAPPLYVYRGEQGGESKQYNKPTRLN